MNPSIAVVFYIIIYINMQMQKYDFFFTWEENKK